MALAQDFCERAAADIKELWWTPFAVAGASCDALAVEVFSAFNVTVVTIRTTGVKYGDSSKQVKPGKPAAKRNSKRDATRAEYHEC
jgi:hypothetical protein